MKLIQKIDGYFKKNKRLQILKTILRVIVLVMLVATIYRIFRVEDEARKFRLLFYICQYTLMLLVLASANILKKKWDITIPIFIDASFVIFAFCGFILGDVLDFYGRIPMWDSILHTFSGVILALVGLVIIDNIVKVQRVPVYLSPLFISITVVLFSLSLGALWEIGEYIYDDFFGTNTQQFMATTAGTLTGDQDVPLAGHAALEDTMKDLMLDFAGAVLVSSTAYFYTKKTEEDKKV